MLKAAWTDTGRRVNVDQIGRAQSGNANWLDAKMFDLRFYNIDLNEASRAAVNRFEFPEPVSFAHYYQGQDTDPTTAEDLIDSEDGTKTGIGDGVPFHYFGNDVPHSYITLGRDIVMSPTLRGIDVLGAGVVVVEDIEGNEQTYVFNDFDATGNAYATFPRRLKGRFRRLLSDTTVDLSNLIALH